jgi:hypothetical protein
MRYYLASMNSCATAVPLPVARMFFVPSTLRIFLIKPSTASNNLSEAEALTRSHDRAEVVQFNVSDRGRVAELVSGADVVVR